MKATLQMVGEGGVELRKKGAEAVRRELLMGH
jgi:hypothetical protein